MSVGAALSPELEQQELSRAITDLSGIAREMGLNPRPTNFEIIPMEQMATLAAYGGLPGRYNHWTAGMDYYKTRTQEALGVTKIYEQVINTDPALAFLQQSNPLAHNKMIVAHVWGHTDFFENNVTFRESNSGNILDIVDLQAQRMRRHAFDHGELAVEELLDSALSIEYCVDMPGNPQKWTSAKTYQEIEAEEFNARQKQKPRTSSFDDLWEIGEKRMEPKVDLKPPFPIDDEHNLLRFIALHSPVLEDWQRDVLDMVHTHSQYFLPQIKTKIMNEGWASFWHVKLMREYGNKDGLNDEEVIEWAKLHANVTVPDPRRINPYYVGFKMWGDIERRFKGEPLMGDRGRVVNEYDWDGEKVDPERFKGSPELDIFNVRADTPTDQAFFRNFLTPGLMKELQLYSYGFNGQDWVIEDKGPREVYEALVHSYTNQRMPLLAIPPGGADFNSSGQLYITHKSEGDGMDPARVKALMPHLFKLWGKPVHLEVNTEEVEKINEGRWNEEKTVKTGTRMLLSCADGKEVQVKQL